MLFWTVSGLIFSWNPIKKVRGENNIRSPKRIDLSKSKLLEIREVLANPKVIPSNSSATMIEIRAMLERPVFEITVRGRGPNHVLVDAVSGDVLSPISKSLAEEIALNDFSEDAKVVRSEYIDRPQGPHSEYRKKEIPVWKVELDHSSGTVIYVSANRGEVVTRRNNRWRMFDFFWMLHTMDYQGRDNFNSWLLRIMSAFGVLSVLTGYWLWFRSRRKSKKKPVD